MLRTVRITVVSATAALCGTLGLGACGTAAGPPPGPRVSLTLSAPGDLSRVSSATTDVQGRVRPARAKVQVLGRAVAVAANGTFSTRVALSVGTNLIDIEASAARSTGAATAVRVVRFLLVTIPDVSGQSPTQATAALKSLGLGASVQGSSDPLNFLIPASEKVCSSTPAAGSRVDPGATVTLHTAKICGL